MMKKIISFVLLLVAMMSVALGQSNRGPQWSPIAQGQNSLQKKWIFVDIGNDAQYQNYWKSVTGGRSAPPPVDFFRDFVILVQLDGKKYPNASFFIKTLDYEGQRLNVRANVTCGASARGNTNGRGSQNNRSNEATYPYVFIKCTRDAHPLSLDITEVPAGSVIIVGGDQHRHNYGDGEDWPQQAAFERIDAGAVSGITQQKEFVIDDEDDFRKYWFALKGKEGMASIPDVDFDRDMVIAIHGGRCNSTGYSVRVWQAFYTNPNQLVIEWYMKTPDPGSYVGTAITTPYQLIVMRRHVNVNVQINHLPGKPIR